MRLSENKDFKKVIHDDYFVNYAARLVLLKSDPSTMESERQQKDVDNSIIAVGYFRQYLSSLIQLGRRAEMEILEAEHTKEEILAEA
jgi:hypothetical protein